MVSDASHTGFILAWRRFWGASLLICRRSPGWPGCLRTPPLKLPWIAKRRCVRVFNITGIPFLFVFISPWSAACRPVQLAGLRFVRIDRNPGRVMALCSRLWLELQRSTFLQSPRYSASPEIASGDDPDFVGRTCHQFQDYVLSAAGVRLCIRTPPRAGRPVGYFTISRSPSCGPRTQC